MAARALERRRELRVRAIETRGDKYVDIGRRSGGGERKRKERDQDLPHPGKCISFWWAGLGGSWESGQPCRCSCPCPPPPRAEANPRGQRASKPSTRAAPLPPCP